MSRDRFVFLDALDPYNHQEMKIVHTDIFRFSIPMEPFTIATGTMDFAQNVLVRIHTDNGLYGLGECSAFPMIVGETQETCLVMARDFARLWKGKDARELKARMCELHDFCAGNTTIKSAFDMALYDLAAKAAGQPLYRYLGGSPRTVETDITIGIGPADAMAAAARAFEQEGANILKIKLGKSVEEDVERLQKIRAAVKPEMTIRIDANQGWSFNDALAAFTAMKDLDIEFCEQPLRTWNDDLLPMLCQQSPVKIMADESVYDHRDAQRLIANKSCHYLNIKLAKSGGIMEALHIHEVAQKEGMACMIGGMLESRLALTANLHFTYACPGIQFYDMDSCRLGHLADPVTGGAQYRGFFLDLPETPGIGADVEDTFLKRCEHWTI